MKQEFESCPLATDAAKAIEISVDEAWFVISSISERREKQEKARAKEMKN